MTHEVFPLVSPGCARIPIMARSTIAPLQRPNTLMQLSRSPSRNSILLRTAGPYILARSGRPAFSVGRPLSARYCCKTRRRAGLAQQYNRSPDCNESKLRRWTPRRINVARQSPQNTFATVSALKRSCRQGAGAESCGELASETSQERTRAVFARAPSVEDDAPSRLRSAPAESSLP
jgi:hypothetical protein